MKVSTCCHNTNLSYLLHMSEIGFEIRESGCVSFEDNLSSCIFAEEENPTSLSEQTEAASSLFAVQFLLL